MQVVGSLIELGIDFVPVPGVKPAFDILNFIWQNVQKASNNREALQNLAMSAADILTAINHVLEEHHPTKHMRSMLHKLELVLNDICLFAAEHASMNLFKLLIKNVDVDGRIEFFQSRLQNLWVAFNIMALGSIGGEVHLIHQGQHGVKVGPSANNPPPHPGLADAAPRKSGAKISANPPEIKSKLSLSHIPRDISDKPVRVRTSSSIPYKLEIRNNAPFLGSRYTSHEQFTYWGLRPDTKTIKKFNRFEIVYLRDSYSWKWSLTGKVISISRHDPKHPSWEDSMDLAFSNSDIAASWFSWFEAYAFSPHIVRSLKDPATSDLTLRKMSSHSTMRKTTTAIEYKRPTAESWLAVLRGNAKTARENSSQLTYISTGSGYGRLPFCTVYRSGDTLVHGRYIRADSLEPMISRRYRFDTVDLARTWYTLWKDCAMNNDRDEDLVQMEIVTKYDCDIQSEHDNILLASNVYRNVDLRDWGAPNFKRTESFETTTFKWMYKQHNMIAVYAVINSRPDWFDTLEIEFRGTKAASTWFSYLTGYSDGAKLSGPPRTENVTITNSRVCWMQKKDDSIETRTGTSDKWTPIFETSYKKFVSHGSHLSVVANRSALPVIRVWINGSNIHLDRRRSVEERDRVFSRRYRFDSRKDAETWYDIWSKRLKRLAAETE